MAQNQRRWASALLLGLCVGATAGATAQSCDAHTALEDNVRVSTGGPYDAKAGSPITLHGTFNVYGQMVNSDRLKIIGQALEAYREVHGTYPPGELLNAKGQPTVSWRVLILPFLGQKELYGRFDLTKPWNDSVNLPLLKEMPEVYRRGNAPDGTTETGFAGVDGPESLFYNASTKLNGGRKIAGITATERLAAGPVGSAVHLPWSAPGDINIQNMPRLGSPHGFSGEGCAITPLLFLDGSVHLMPNSIAAGPLVAWTRISPAMSLNRCPCAPPSSLDAGLRATWDLGKEGTPNTQGWDVTFKAPKSGKYTVTLHGSDHFGNQYTRSTTVDVR